MAITVEALCREIDIRRTALLFGAGSSIPSGGLTGNQLAREISEKFQVGRGANLGLADVASLVELKRSRSDLVSYIRMLIYPLRPTGGLLEIPRYSWREIFMTNYDNLVERAYANLNIAYTVISANYEFEKERDGAINIYKLHGTIDKDKVDGDLSRLIISNQDYTDAQSYREDMYDRLLVAGSSNTLLMIGHSLADPDLNSIIDEAVRRRSRSGSVGKVYVLSYQRDDDRALLLEQRGLRVAFGSLDEFVTALADTASASTPPASGVAGALSSVAGLPGLATEVSHARSVHNSDAVRMFYGSPASYADIEAGMTFRRDIAAILHNILTTEPIPFLLVTGVAGVGKTTAVRQALVELSRSGTQCYEHASDRPLSTSKWLELEASHRRDGSAAVLFVDDAHKYISEVGALIDGLAQVQQPALKVIACTSRAHWNIRTKSETLYILGREVTLNQLSSNEIDRLLDLFQSEPKIAGLVEREFSGFSRVEKRRRLVERCRSDFFVCLRNIMSTELLDDIILREYGDLDDRKREIYKMLSGLEAAGVRVHRQAMIRLQNISAEKISELLDDMDGMISESLLDEQHGIYTWTGRHPVISSIIANARYANDADLFELFDGFIDQANTSYFIERVNLQELCNSEGVRRIANRETQNVLFRKMISKAPTIHPPRHRLISNLIAQGSYERAEDEIRIFESDLGGDGPLLRYKAQLRMRRAEHVKGLLEEDRRRLVEHAAEIVEIGIDRHPHDKLLLETYCAAGLQYVKQFGDWSIIDRALDVLKRKSELSADPEVKRLNNTWVLKVQEIKSGRSNRSNSRGGVGLAKEAGGTRT